MKSNPQNSALVIGANGYIGKNLCFWLLQNGFKVIAVGRANFFVGSDSIDCANLTYICADLLEQNEVNALPFSKVNMIFLMNGKTGTSRGFIEPMSFLLGNDGTLLNILTAYSKQNAMGRLVFPSTRLVYEGKENTFLAEDSVKSPKTVYGINKLSCEQYLRAWGNAFKSPFTIFRICVPYGQLFSGDYSFGTAGMMIEQANTKGVISLYGGGSTKRTFTHIADVCKIMVEVSQMKAAENLTINIGGPDNMSLLGLAKLVAKKFDAQVKQIEWPSLDLSIETGDTLFSDALLKSIYEFHYEKNLSDYFS